MSDYAEQIDYPPTFAEFVCRYSFVDDQEVYTNGATLVPTFRVTDAFEHYIGYEHERYERLAQMAREMYWAIDVFESRLDAEHESLFEWVPERGAVTRGVKEQLEALGVSVDD